MRAFCPVPYPASTRLSLVDLQDVATVAAKILMEPGHEYATYELVATRPMSQTAVADTFSKILQRPVEVRPVSVADWESQARAKGANDFAMETAVSMFTYYAQSGMAGNPHQLRYLLGQDPTSLSDFIKRITSG